MEHRRIFTVQTLPSHKYIVEEVTPATPATPTPPVTIPVSSDLYGLFDDDDEFEKTISDLEDVTGKITATCASASSNCGKNIDDLLDSLFGPNGEIPEILTEEDKEGQARMLKYLTEDLSTEKKKDEKKKQIIVFDNDELTGSYGLLSMYYKMFFHHGYFPAITDRFIPSVVQLMENGVARPGLTNIMKHVEELKKKGLIDAVVMYTSAPNAGGWVDFLKLCIEIFCKTPNLFDLVIHRDTGTQVVTPEGATYKNMELVRRLLGYSADSQIIMFDDKPQNIIGNAKVVGLPEYRHIIPREIYYGVFTSFSNLVAPGDQAFKQLCMLPLCHPQGWIQDSFYNTMRNIPHDQSGDRALFTHATRTITESFDFGLKRTCSDTSVNETTTKSKRKADTSSDDKHDFAFPKAPKRTKSL